MYKGKPKQSDVLWEFFLEARTIHGDADSETQGGRSLGGGVWTHAPCLASCAWMHAYDAPI